jgi:hypothetical protein
MTRPPIPPRSEQPFTTLDTVLMQMIRAHEGRPCPTRQEIREWTGMPRRRIWAYLEGMQARGLIELEVCASLPALRRRLRVVGEAWTDWTARRPVTENAA